MREISKDLGEFQVNLSQQELAKVTPKIATEVFASISYLEDTAPTKLGRQTGVHCKTMCNYCDKNKAITPNFNKFVHLMEKLGYDVFLRKKTHGSI